MKFKILQSIFCFLVLIKSCQLLKLECDFVTIKLTREIGPLETCNHKSIIVTENNEKLKGTSSDTLRCEGIKQLLFSNTTIKYLPKDIGSLFPNLISLKVGSVQLEHIFKDDFKGVQKLQSLFLWGNEIQKISPDTFSELYELKELNLGFNKIVSLEEGLFKSNLKLKKLFLNVNQIQIIHPQMIRNLKDLTHLNLESNKCIDKYFKKSSDFEQIDNILKKCHTKVKEAPPGKASPMICYTGESIDNVYSCSIDDLKMPRPNDIIDYVSVEHVEGKSEEDINLLTITNSSTKYIRNNLLLQFPYLNTLIIKDCEWEGISNLYGTKQLVKLFINFNKIETLKADVFEGMLRVRTISLRNNEIEEINPNAFSYLSKLQFLDLSNNDVRTLDENLFHENNHLTKLNLAHNKIKTLPMNMFKLHIKLHYIFFNNNEIRQLIKKKEDKEYYDVLDLTGNICDDSYVDRKSSRKLKKVANSNDLIPNCYNGSKDKVKPDL